MRSKKILFLGQTIYLYIVFQYPSPYDYSIYTDYLRVSFLEFIFTFVALFCNISLMVFFRSPYSSASHRRRPLLMFKISQSWSKLQ